MTKVKICGITNIDDAYAAAGSGADLIGFIFYPPSPRYVEPDLASEIVRTVRSFSPGLRFVGVFVNQPTDRVADVARRCSLDLVQFSGDESPGMLEGFSGRAFKSLRPRDPDHARSLLTSYSSEQNQGAPDFIVDAFNPHLFGGTGERTDWHIARDIASRHRILLAGGLSPENVAEAVALVRPWGVDVSSGVERTPGLKDHSKVKRFIENAKALEGVKI